jgi:HEPN domain-containing protein
VQKAEGDFVSALREYRARKLPNFDAAGFHAQQCIEKYLKAFLQMHNIRFEKIHDLLALKELCLSSFPELEFYKESLGYLNQFSVSYRYPGDSVSKEQAKNAVTIMGELRSIIKMEMESIETLRRKQRSIF